jgi:hypothetical protein
MEQSFEVQLEHLGELLGLQLEHRLAPVYAGDVDGYVYPAGPSFDLSRRREHALPVSDVDLYRQTLAPLAARSPLGRTRPLLIYVQTSHIAPKYAKPSAIALPSPEAAPVTTAR